MSTLKALSKAEESALSSFTEAEQSTLLRLLQRLCTRLTAEIEKLD